MREIKFRCFNKHSMVMHPWDQLVQLNKIHLLDEQKGSYPVMQFTGLKDINGVDIYEGDVVDDETGVPMIVHFQDGCFSVKFKGTERGAFYLDDYDFEVIGNIYENPELLENKND